MRVLLACVAVLDAMELAFSPGLPLRKLEAPPFVLGDAANIPPTFSDNESPWPSTQLELAERSLNATDFTTAAPVEVSIGPDAAPLSLKAALHEEREELAAARRRTALQMRHIPVASTALEADGEGLASWVQELEQELGPEQRSLRNWWPASFLEHRLGTGAVIWMVVGGAGLFGLAAVWRVHVNSRDEAAVRIQAAYRGSAERTSILSAVNAADENDLRDRLVEGQADS